MTATIGLDIGGTKISAAVVSDDGVVLASVRAQTPATEPDAIVTTCADLVRRLTAEHEVEAVGVAAAAFVDAARATVRFAPNIAWRDAPLRALLEDQLRLPVVIENDANAAAWGEFLYGPARDVDHMVLITIGTGVGGGIVLDGQLMRGAFGIAGELGHLRVIPGGVLCGCGNRGCWEQYASGNALVREARSMILAQSPVTQDLAARVEAEPGGLTGPLITEAAKAGDPTARELLAEVGHWLGVGLANIAAALDPGAFVIGGGVSAAGDLLIAPARETFQRKLAGRGYRPEATVAAAALGNDAGLIGAADLARANADG